MMESSIPKPFTTLSPEEKYVKRTIIDQLCIRVWREKVMRSGKVKRGFITNLIGHNTKLCPTLTRDTLNNALCKYNKAGNTSETISGMQPARIALFKALLPGWSPRMTRQNFESENCLTHSSDGIPKPIEKG